MPPIAILLIVLSAVLHAAWNLMAKKQHMTIPYYGILCLVGMTAWSHTLVWSPVRLTALPPAFWGFLGLTLFGEFLYFTGIMVAYARMDISTAYPLIRSIPILLTALISAGFGLGAPLSHGRLAGMAVVFAGCLTMLLKPGRDSGTRTRNRSHALLFILMTACGTTCYTIGDSETQHAIRNASPDIPTLTLAMTYYGIRAVSLSAAIWLTILAIPAQRTIAAELFAKKDWHPLLAGLCSTSTYILVLTATNMVDNVAYIPVFRQLGLPIGMAAGILILKEPCTLAKCIGCALILAGLTLTVIL